MDPKEYIKASDGNGEAVRAIVTEDRGVTNMALIVDSILNWPHKFIATSGEVDADDIFIPETVTVFYGYLDGSIIMIEEFAPGYSDIGNFENQVVVLKPTTPWADSVAAAVEGASSLPDGGLTGQALIKASDADQDVEWGSGGGVSIITKETPGGAVDGVNANFTTALPYVGGSLQGYINGIAQSNFIAEVNPTLGTFSFDVPPLVGDNVRVAYHYAPSETGGADTLDGYHLSGIIEALYPVGAVFISGSNTMPTLIASIGTWVRLEGYAIVGVDPAQTEFDVVNKVGGAKTHTLTTAQMPTHSHGIWSSWDTAGSNLGDNFKYSKNATTGTNPPSFRNSGAGTAQFIENAGGNQPHNNLQPYKTKFMWERTA